MHANKINNTFAPEIYESYRIKNITSKFQQKNFVNGLQNARKLLEGLEQSISKTAQYEAKLLRCRARHAHSHDELWWSSDRSDEKGLRNNIKDTANSSRAHINLTESWSTMSIVCLQYQYEELSKRYEALLKAFHERSNVVTARDASIARLRARARESYAQLAHAHKTLLCIGEKYLNLWNKKQLLKQKHEKRVQHLKATIRGMVAMCEHARLELDNRILRFMEKEHLAPNAQLLVEIRRCNLLYLENLRLKARIENMTPGTIFIEN